MGISYSTSSAHNPPRKQGFNPATYFTIKSLNPSTHVIQEHDVFHESPLIYAKRIDQPRPFLLICDTGCGTTHRADDLNGPIHNLRSFIETYPVTSNSDEPLNPHGRIPYLILCSHCHYDHILGIPQFVPEGPHSRDTIGATIIASSHCPSFVSSHNLPEHSLCTYIGLATPHYRVGIWAGDAETLSVQGKIIDSNGTRIVTLHIPGHTPDSLAWYDERERWIYVGDTFYERFEGGGADGAGEPMPIEFGSEGDLVAYMGTLNKLLEFVKARNKENGCNMDDDDDWEYIDADALTAHGSSSDSSKSSNDGSAKNSQRVRLGCAHVTSSVDAESTILAVQQYFWRLLKGGIPVHDRGTDDRRESMGLWEEEDGKGERRFSVLAPERLVEEARKHFHIDI